MHTTKDVHKWLRVRISVPRLLIFSQVLDIELVSEFDGRRLQPILTDVESLINDTLVLDLL